jgi:thiosulfate dehydrogenase
MRSAFVAIAVVLTYLTGSFAIAAETDAGKIARGGRLYDKWYKEAKLPEPTGNHVSWPASNAEKSGADTFRCKSCHGWDLLGNAGAYSKGSWFTDIKGVNGAAGKEPAAIVDILKGDAHGFGGVIADDDLTALAMFVAAGPIDMDPYIDRATKKAKGDVAEGARLYETVCAGCHSADGKGVKDAEPMGVISNDNPWEVFHKISFGQPAESMPAMLVFGPKVAGDILAYLQTLPAE